MSVDPLFSVKGRVAAVSGASSGIGQHLASVLLAKGAKVVAFARRTERLEEWKRTQKGECEVIATDLSETENIEKIANAIADPFGAPDILLNAAGLNLREPADDVTYDSWHSTISINLTAPFFLAQAMIPAMKAKQWGRIVHCASLQSTRAFPGGIAYGAAKGGIVQLTRAMAEAWSRFGITTNAIGPGFFPTELTSVIFSDKERSARNAAQTCIGRNGRLEDLDGPLLFLCSDASAYVTGQLLYVDGGFTSK